MAQKALIFGAAGQDGHYLAEILSQSGVECIKTARNREGYQQCDVSSLEQVESLIRLHNPHYVFHLAATSSINHDFALANHKAIVDGTFNILETVKRDAPGCRVFLSGSALQFKESEEPIHEDSALTNSSIYSAQRNASLCLAKYYREHCRLSVYFGFFFHHDSPRRGNTHLAQRIASTVRRIKAGSHEKLHLYEPGVKKEWTFAGDTMSAVWLLMNQKEVNDIVIGTGVSHSIMDWVKVCFRFVGLNWENHVVIDETGKPPAMPLVSRPDRLKALGWSPKVDLLKLAELMLVPAEESSTKVRHP